MKQTFDFEVYMTIDDEDFTVRGEAVFYPGSPGKTYGLPEDCYEAESEYVEIVSEVWYDENSKEVALLRGLNQYEEDTFYEKVCDHCVSAYEELCDQGY